MGMLGSRKIQIVIFSWYGKISSFRKKRWHPCDWNFHLNVTCKNDPWPPPIALILSLNIVLKHLQWLSMIIYDWNWYFSMCFDLLYRIYDNFQDKKLIKNMSQTQVLPPLKGYRGGPGKKISISFILIYVIALSFFFPKWGHTLLNYCYFWFYVHSCDGGIVKYREKRTL